MTSAAKFTNRKTKVAPPSRQHSLLPDIVARVLGNGASRGERLLQQGDLAGMIGMMLDEAVQ